MNKAFRIIPLFSFILLALFWIAESYLSLGMIHYTASLVFILLVIQLIYNNKYMGLLYSVILSIFSCFMLVDSILDHFSTALPTDGTFRFMLIKFALFGSALIMAALMLSYYLKFSGLKSHRVNSTSQ
jgi:hypothetical protein